MAKSLNGGICNPRLNSGSVDEVFFGTLNSILNWSKLKQRFENISAYLNTGGENHEI